MGTTSNREGRRKTWKVLRDGTKHGDSVRNYGDFLPEAPGLETFSSLLRADLIEEVWVDDEEFEEWEQRQKERDEALLLGVDPDVEEDVEDDDDEDEDTVGAHTAVAPTPVAPKKVTKKKSVKKTAVVKKGKTSGNLTEQPAV